LSHDGALLGKNLGMEDEAMKVNCLSCGQEMNMDHQAFNNFRGSLKCVNCRGVMEIQTMRGVLIWGYPLSEGNPDFTGRTAERNLYREQKKI
jgi:Zn finger protein HypA/HybF involved in hydrogenase expression